MNIENAIDMVFVKDFLSLPGSVCLDFAAVALDGWSVSKSWTVTT